LNTHVETREGRQFSVFASFFRTAALEGRDPETGVCHRNHSLAWGVVDVESKQYYPVAVLDPDSPQVVIQSIKDGQMLIDPKIEQALVDICSKGTIPLPDRAIEGPIIVAEKNNLNLQYGEGNTLVKTTRNSYMMECTDYDGKVSCKLDFTPQRPATRQGHNGIVKVGRNRETMFYYFIPRCAVEGTIIVNGQEFEVSGNGWYDHEFGGEVPMKRADGQPAKEKRSADEPDYAWNWLSCQLTNGLEITATNLIDPFQKKTFDNFAIILGEDRREEYESSQLVATRKWRSCKSFMDYPVEWKLTVSEIDLDLTISASFDDQEFMTMIARPAFWEGRVTIQGRIGNEEVEGFGFVEVYGHDDLRCMKRVLKNVGKCVFDAVELAVPHHPSDEQLAELIGGEEYMEGFSREVYQKTVLEPIRDIVDRGGKSWRSYALLLCIDAVGGDSRPWRHWLGLPELVHTGSLIVDDVQDQSQIRRGGPSVHLMYGDALAINAGSAAYFLTSMIKFPEGTPEHLKVKIYQLYFQGLRSGHAGQALDINGLDYVMNDIVITGEGKRLEQMVMATHKLKSAAPAASVARMGAIAGNGSPEQVQKMGRFFEALGIAFQIFDDVLNLRGFEGNLKDRGEDLVQGKVTYPVAKAMSYLRNVEDRKWLWETIKSKPQDRSVVEACIDMIEKCGAMSAAAKEGMDMMEEAWREVDAVLSDSYFKIMLRALSYYLLDRMY
jgi:geranylgeranyl pyrophosphate synthase